MANRRHRRGKRAGAPPHDTGIERIFGLHAAEAVLNNPTRQIRQVFVTGNAAQRLAPALATCKATTHTVCAAELASRLGRDTVHQGILVETAPLPEPDFDQTVVTAAENPEAGPLIVVDQVTDPHNAGAILRSAAAFGAAALVMTRRNSPPGDGVFAKAASGAVEHVPVVKVTNLARALADMGSAGLFRIGLDSEASEPLETAPLAGPCALVLGAEDKGLRRLTRENCDFLCRIPTSGKIASLNVSNAAAVALHACLQARGTGSSDA